jgi:thiol:disulfide interchange protein DsbC
MTRKALVAAMSLALLAVLLQAGCEKPKATLTKEKAEEALHRISPKISVVSLRPGPVDGLWEVGVKRNSSLTIAYLDTSGTYLFIVENVVNTVSLDSVIEEPMMEMLRVDPSRIPEEDSIIMGAKDAENRIYVFTDPECPYCRLLHPELKEVVASRPDIAFYIKMLPLIQQHPDAYEKSRAVMCAESDEKALRMLESAYMGKELPAPACDTNAVDNTMALIDEFSLNGTPTLFFPDGMRIAGAVKAADIIGVVDEIAAEKTAKEPQAAEKPKEAAETKAAEDTKTTEEPKQK